MKNKIMLLVLCAMALTSGCASKTDAKLVDNKEVKISRNVLEINLLTGEVVEAKVSPKPESSK